MPVDLSPEVASDCLWLVRDELGKVSEDLDAEHMPDPEELTLSQKDFIDDMGRRLRMLTSILNNAIEYV